MLLERIWVIGCATMDSPLKVSADGLAFSSGILRPKYMYKIKNNIYILFVPDFLSRLPVPPHPVHSARPPWNHLDRAEEVWIRWRSGAKSGLPLSTVSFKLGYRPAECCSYEQLQWISSFWHAFMHTDWLLSQFFKLYSIFILIINNCSIVCCVVLLSLNDHSIYLF